MRHRRPRVLTIIPALLVLCACDTSSGPDVGGVETHLRYLAINAGNASPQFRCWESKLCRPQDVEHLREYIAYWQPDIIMLSEAYSQGQFTGTDMNGPILPTGYVGMCDESRDRNTGDPAAFDAKNASHEHECVAWKTSRFGYVQGSDESADGRNDDFGKKKCHYDFTGFRARTYLKDPACENAVITAVAVHPDSTNAACRAEEISRYWSQLADGDRTIIGGDWNTDKEDEIQVPDTFQINYSRGYHWDIYYDPGEYSAEYVLGIKRKLDHAFSNFGTPCTDCGKYYGTPDLVYGSALGGYHDHPRADGGQGMDHRQILVDIKFRIDPCISHE